MVPKEVKPEPEIVKNYFDIPVQYNKKLTELLPIINKNPNCLQSNSKGELILNGNLIPDSSYVDSFREIYRHSSKHNTLGQSQFLSVLSSLKIPPDLLSNSIIRTQYLKLLKPKLDLSTSSSSYSQYGSGTPLGKRPRILFCYKH